MVTIDQLKKEQIIPDVLPEFAPQDVSFKVTFGSHNVTGSEIPLDAVQTQPQVSLKGEEGQYYTLAFVDPDAPSRSSPSNREWRHWVVVNIPSSDFSKGGHLSDFFPSAPPAGSGLHRYVFILYKQNGKLVASHFDDTAETKARSKFHVSDWAGKFNLTPISATFYLCQKS
eukprot:TRINITY_DN1829_c1_g1_i1.p1 TRINITY_DN1829_c1_g1~~TRINITY_DN1829_c1_g1_i1.p1  ORF type:complete len:171 (-),score=45.49 TRINITY_DN1829_c1_g1_i1:394-906(-)